MGEGGVGEGGVGEGGVGDDVVIGAGGGATLTEVPNCQLGGRHYKFRFSCVALFEF